MTNRSSSKQHGLVGNIRPKSKARNRKNKEGAAERRKKKQAELQKKVEAARAKL